MSASDPFDWIKHTLERIENDMHDMRHAVQQLQKCIVELEARERERDRMLEEHRRNLDMKLRIVHLIIPTGIFGMIVWVWQWLRGQSP